MNILILSRNSSLYSTRSLVLAARRRGHYVRVIDHMECDLVMDTGKLEVYFHDENITGFDAVIPRIGSSSTAYGSAVVRQFQCMGLFSTLHHEALLRARNKISSMQLLAANQVGIPRTAISNNYYTIPETLEKVNSMPIIIKLEKGTHGLGVVLSNSMQNAEAIVESFHKLNQRAIIQEFIEESKGADIRVFIVDKEIVGVMQRQACKGEFRSNLHRGGTSSVVELSSEEIEISLKAAEIMGTTVCGIDLLRSKKGPLVLEVNASPGLQGIETTTGIDIASKIIDFCEKSTNSSIAEAQ